MKFNVYIPDLEFEVMSFIVHGIVIWNPYASKEDDLYSNTVKFVSWRSLKEKYPEARNIIVSGQPHPCKGLPVHCKEYIAIPRDDEDSTLHIEAMHSFEIGGMRKAMPQNWRRATLAYCTQTFIEPCAAIRYTNRVATMVNNQRNVEATPRNHPIEVDLPANLMCGALAVYNPTDVGTIEFTRSRGVTEANRKLVRLVYQAVDSIIQLGNAPRADMLVTDIPEFSETVKNQAFSDSLRSSLTTWMREATGLEKRQRCESDKAPRKDIRHMSAFSGESCLYDPEEV